MCSVIGSEEVLSERHGRGDQSFLYLEWQFWQDVATLDMAASNPEKSPPSVDVRIACAASTTALP